MPGSRIYDAWRRVMPDFQASISIEMAASSASAKMRDINRRPRMRSLGKPAIREHFR